MKIKPLQIILGLIIIGLVAVIFVSARVVDNLNIENEYYHESNLELCNQVNSLEHIIITDDVLYARMLEENITLEPYDCAKVSDPLKFRQ